jgi:hypothetical protein
MDRTGYPYRIMPDPPSGVTSKERIYQKPAARTPPLRSGSCSFYPDLALFELCAATAVGICWSESKQEFAMAQCEVCGNDYDKSFEVMLAGKSHVFDSFECAIQALAPKCAHCDCRILGHGVEAKGKMFCCAHCAGMSGVKGMKDRA